MTLERTDPDNTPPPADLAADSELRAFMRDHPAAAAEGEDLRRLTRLCREHRAAEPAPAVWDATFRRIETGLAAPKPTSVPKRGTPALRIGVGIGVAAACVAGLLLTHALLPPPVKTTERSVVVAEEEPYPVATADEIVILSMNPANTQNLVVGKPPVHGDLVLAGPDDVTLMETNANNGGQVPEMRYGGTVPVLVPTATWGDKDKED